MVQAPHWWIADFTPLRSLQRPAAVNQRPPNVLMVLVYFMNSANRGPNAKTMTPGRKQTQ